ncbi:hypothetical protein, partial [Streptomyces lonarensis]|uniref:hypothetical protein n=1 Tax=Streptomyces lonarensis TaxID=700599 RepID=UPI0030C6733B
MIPEAETTSAPLFTLAARSPWRERVAQRWASRRDRALVLRDRDGGYHLAGGNRSPSATTKPQPGIGIDGEDDFSYSAPGGFRYDAAFYVRLDEAAGTLPISLPGAHQRESHDVHIRWWVRNPVEVVRSRTTDGWSVVRGQAVAAVREVFERYRTAGRHVSPAELLSQLSDPRELHDTGLTYHAVEVRERDDEREVRLGAGDDTGPPASWAEIDKEAYAFCLRAVRDGPASLAALWLVRHPDQVREVLDWSVAHAELLRGETTWQNEMAGMLGTLSAEEQGELSEVVRDRLAALGRPVPGAPAPGAGAGPGPGGGAGPSDPGAGSGGTRAPYPAKAGA